MEEKKSNATIERAYRVRAYPSMTQQRLLAQLFGARRFVWNWALDRRRRAYLERKEKLNAVALSRELTVLRGQPETAWLRAMPVVPLQQVLRDLDRAFSNFFAKRARYSRFKKKTYAGAARFTLDQRRTQVDREVGRLHAKIRDARQDLLHQTTTHLVRQHALIGIETLNVKGMQRGMPRVRRRIGNACLGEVRRQLTYKSEWANRTLILVDRFFASSQLCSVCGWKNASLQLKDRRWQCAQCGITHDRDHNAAKNILAEELRVSAANAAS